MTLPLRTSVRNAFLARRGKRCDCRPYFEILAKTRWSAMGYAPKTKARPAIVRVWRDAPAVDRTGSRLTTSRRTQLAHLFCRCQVEPAARQRAPRAA